MHYTYPSKPMRDRARQLRRDQTDVERALWMRIRGRQLAGAKFRRQQPIGRYVVDFCCAEVRLVVELDGGQHNESSDADAKRTAFLSAQGYRVLRFWNNEVLENMDGVLERIVEEVRSPHPNPLPEGEGTGERPTEEG